MNPTKLDFDTLVKRSQDLDGTKSRWSKFVKLTICPECFDDKGHAGILPSGWARCVKCGHSWRPQSGDGVPLDRRDLTASREFKPLDIFALYHANSAANEIISALDPQAAVAALMKHRGYDVNLAQWLVKRGVRFGSVANLRFKVSTSLFGCIKLPKGVDINESMIWLPVIVYNDRKEPFVVAFQLRRIAPDANPRYVTVRLLEDAPLAHVALPTVDRTDGQRWTKVWLTEGIFKAEIVAHEFDVVAVGALGTGGLRNAVEAVINAARWWHRDANLFSAPVILAPDADARTQVGTAKAWWKAAKTLEGEGFKISFAIWNHQYKGIDDVLLAGEIPTTVSPEEWLSTLSPQTLKALVDFRPRKWLWTADLPDALSPLTVATPNQEEKADFYANRTTLKSAIAQAIGQGFRFIHIALRTGEGKTDCALRLKTKEIGAKRILFIHPAPHQLPDRIEGKRRRFVPKNWHRVFGRSAVGYVRLHNGTYREAMDGEKPHIPPNCSFTPLIRELVRYGYSGKDACSVCPVRQQCQGAMYLAQIAKASKHRYLLGSWWLLADKVAQDATVILDEPSQLPLWNDASFTPEDVDKACKVLPLADLAGERITRLETGLRHIAEAMREGRDLSKDDIVALFEHDDLVALAAQSQDPQARKQTIKEIMEDYRRLKSIPPIPAVWLKTFAEILTGIIEGDAWIENGKLNLRWRDPRWIWIKQKARHIILNEAKPTDQLCAELGLERGDVARISGDPEILPQKLLQVVDLPPLHRRATEKRATRYLQVVKAFLQAIGVTDSPTLGVLLPKRYAPIAQKLWKQAFVGWFGLHDRGSNALFERGVETLVVIGLPIPNLSRLLAKHGLAGQRQRVWRFYQVAGGFVSVKEFMNEKAAEIVRQALRESYIQIAGRLRQSLRPETPTTLIIIGSQPTGLPTQPLFARNAVPDALYRTVVPDLSKRTEAANTAKRLALAERMRKLAEAEAIYRSIIGESASVGWLSKATGIPRQTVWRSLRTVSHVTCKYNDGGNHLPLSCETVCKPSTYREAVDAFRKAGLPVPVSAIAKRFGVSKTAVSKYARKSNFPLPNEGMVDTLTFLEDTFGFENIPECPSCPACGTPLEPDPDGTASCVGCGRAWQVTGGQIRAPCGQRG